MSTQDEFHDDVIERLAELRVGQSSIVTHLDKLNGSVSKIWGELRETQQDILKHALDCPLREKVELLDSQLLRGEHPGSVTINARMAVLEQKLFADEKAQEKEDELAAHHECTRNKWEDRLWPLALVIAFVIVELVLEHAGLFQSALHRK